MPYKLSATRIFEIAYAHHLPQHKGKCKDLHGHNAKIEVTFTGQFDNTGDGMVMDFGDMKKIVGNILDAYDHKCLNDLSGCIRPTIVDNVLGKRPIFHQHHQPTAENLSVILMFDINSMLALYATKCTCTKIVFWETPNCFVTIEEV